MRGRMRTETGAPEFRDILRTSVRTVNTTNYAYGIGYSLRDHSQVFVTMLYQRNLSAVAFNKRIFLVSRRSYYPIISFSFLTSQFKYTPPAIRDDKE